MKLPRRRQFLHLAAGAAALPAVSQLAPAQAYPPRPVRIIVGFPAGGTTDIMARLMGQWLSERLGQQFVIENRPGAAGNIAAEAVVKAAPTSRHQFDRSGMTFFGSDAKNSTIQTHRRTTSLKRNSPVRFHAIGSVDTLHFTTPGVEKKNDHVIANVPIPINEPSADRIGTNAPAARIAAVVNSIMPSKLASPLIPKIDNQETNGLLDMYSAMPSADWGVNFCMPNEIKIRTITQRRMPSSQYEPWPLSET